MYRFLAKPKWIAFTALVVAAFVLMVNLGFWQLHRLDERKAFNSLVESRISSEVAPLAEVLALPTSEREYRTVTLVGAYRGVTEQVPIAGAYLLVTPFAVDGGDTVFVDRGSISSAATAPDPPPGRVEMTARFRTAPDAAQSVGDDATYLDRIESTPAEREVTPRQLPALDAGPHLSYAVQWFIFSICVLVGWVLAVRRSARPSIVTPTSGDGPDGARDADRARRRRRQQAVPWQDEASTPAER